MKDRYVKSDAGHQEIKDKTRKLSRTTRNLLLIVDDTRPIATWMQLVQGATAADLQTLVDEGLMKRSVSEPTGSATPLSHAVDSLSYDQLYALLTSQAKERLGLIRGFKLVLSVEKCTDLGELKQLALEFLEQVKAQQGEEAARSMFRSWSQPLGALAA